jgi:predicted nucleic acid-binding protein
MRLVVDTSVLVAELLRARGRDRLGDSRLDLYIPEQTWGEVQHELPRRVLAFARRHSISAPDADELARLCLAAARANVAVVDAVVLVPLEEEARSRALRDPDDWPLVAGALVLRASVWTLDDDLLGTGVPTWTTDTLQLWLDRTPLAG